MPLGDPREGGTRAATRESGDLPGLVTLPSHGACLGAVFRSGDVHRRGVDQWAGFLPACLRLGRLFQDKRLRDPFQRTFRRHCHGDSNHKLTTNGRFRLLSATHAPRVLAALSIVLLASSSLASAQTTVLPDLVVTSATLVATPLAQIPNSVTVITAEDIEQQQRRTVPDVLRTVPASMSCRPAGPVG